MIRAVACATGALGIAAGAFGAHWAASAQAAEWLKTGGLYQLIHAVAALAVLRSSRGAAATMLAGAALFAATLYAMALGAPHWLGAVTPIGGTAMIAGWLWAALASGRG